MRLGTFCPGSHNIVASILGPAHIKRLLCVEILRVIWRGLNLFVRVSEDWVKQKTRVGP